jgi:hypothetical protein
MRLTLPVFRLIRKKSVCCVVVRRTDKSISPLENDAVNRKLLTACSAIQQNPIADMVIDGQSTATPPETSHFQARRRWCAATAWVLTRHRLALGKNNCSPPIL